jgi:hypothetical protein
VLEHDYYLNNFLSLVRFVEKTYSSLLSQSEHDWLQAVLALNEPAQRLYIRLSARQASSFKLSKLRYDEIDSIDLAAKSLCDTGLAHAHPPGELTELLQAFTKPEIIKLLSLQDKRQLARADLLEYIIQENNEAHIVSLQQADQWITVKGHAEYAIFKLCFFGNCYQDMSEFVLRDLGVFNYEPYRIDAQSKVFHTRDQLAAHLAYFDCADIFEQLDQSSPRELIDLAEQLPHAQKTDHQLLRRVDRLRNRIARQLERLDCLDEALGLYSQSDRVPARERRVRILAQQERFSEALVLCHEIKSCPLAEEELTFLDVMLPRLHKQLNMSASKVPRFRPVTVRVTLSKGDGRVEMVAQKFYSQYGECHYVENALINGVFGLFIWDIIFAPVSGVFYNPFQSAPADFYLPEFIAKRQTMLDERFLELQDSVQFAARVWENYESRRGIMNPLVNWRNLNDSLLTQALVKIPLHDWRSLFNRLLLDLRNHTSGLPDLILFPNSGSYELLEIKGPGDVIQSNQRRWMAYFNEHRIPYRVVHIKWAAEKST